MIYWHDVEASDDYMFYFFMKWVSGLKDLGWWAAQMYISDTKDYLAC